MAQEMKLELKLDAGFVTVPIVDDKDGQELGHFKFNPNDLDIVQRYKHVVEVFESITVPEDPDENVLFEISDKVKDQFDYLLNFKVSDDIFSICNPFSLTADGDFYIEKVIDGIAGLIEHVTNQRIEKKTVKIRKATQKYVNGGMKGTVKQFNSISEK